MQRSVLVGKGRVLDIPESNGDYSRYYLFGSLGKWVLDQHGSDEGH